MAQVTRFVRDIDGKLVVDAATGKPITVTYETTGGGAVDSVNGKVGVVVLDAEDVGAEPAFEKKSAFNKEFGTTAGTVCQGNDSRLSDARPANGGNSATVGGKSPSDFATSEQGEKADTAYQKPSTGIPESDLSQDVQDKLNESGGSSYTLPIASATTLGGVQPVTKTTGMTQTVGVDATGKLWTVPGSGGGGSGEVTKEAIASALGLTTQQLDQLAALSKKLTVSGNNVTFTSGTVLQSSYFDAVD